MADKYYFNNIKTNGSEIVKKITQLFSNILKIFSDFFVKPIDKRLDIGYNIDNERQTNT